MEGGWALLPLNSPGGRGVSNEASAQARPSPGRGIRERAPDGRPAGLACRMHDPASGPLRVCVSRALHFTFGFLKTVNAEQLHTVCFFTFKSFKIFFYLKTLKLFCLKQSCMICDL